MTDDTPKPPRMSEAELQRRLDLDEEALARMADSAIIQRISCYRRERDNPEADIDFLTQRIDVALRALKKGQR